MATKKLQILGSFGTGESSVYVDDTLTISGAAADAKAVGDKFSDVETQIGDINTLVGDKSVASQIEAIGSTKADVGHSHTPEEIGADVAGSAEDALTSANSYTDTKIADLINSAPTTLDTLGEIATAMEENADVVAALDTAIGTKADKTTVDALSELVGDQSVADQITNNAVSKTGDTMTGSLTTTALSINRPTSNYPSLNFYTTSGKVGLLIQPNLSDGVRQTIFYQYPSEMDEAETRYMESFRLPVTSGTLTGNVAYSILTSKELSKWQSTFMNSFVVNHTIDVQTTDVLSLPPGIYHHEAATSTDNNYPISETRALVEVKGQYRAGTAATDGYPNGYWSVCVTYPYSGKKYWNHRTWSTWTGWRDLTAGSTGNITAESIGAVKKSGDTMTGTLWANGGFAVKGNYDINILSSYKHGYYLKAEDGNTTVGGMSIDPTTNKVSFSQKMVNQNYYETYYLPAPASTAANKDYNILTTKSAVTVAQGGTGKTTLTSGQALIGNGTGAITTRSIKHNTTVGTLGWSDNSNALTTLSTIAYWNGAYSDTSSNLTVLGTVTTGKWQATAVGVAYGGTGATSAAGARTNLGITCANLGALPLSGGTMTGTITLHTTGLKTSSTSGFSTNQHGNFVHQTNTESHNWSICNSANTAKFQVWYETGAVTAQGKVTAPCFGGNGIRYSSSQPTTNLVTGQIWLKPV